jgi:hypothetical protein
MAELTGMCPEREFLLSLWTDCSNRITGLRDELLAAIRNEDGTGVATLNESIRIAKHAEIDACRAYYGHVNAHECV